MNDSKQGGKPHQTVGVMQMELHCGCCPMCVMRSGGMAPYITMAMVEAKQLPDGSLMVDPTQEPEPVGMLVMN